MKEEIDFGDYLSPEEKRDIVEEVFRSRVQKALATANDVERFIGNVAYVSIEGIVNDILSKEGNSAREIIAEKAATIIRNMTPYSVFQTGGGALREKPSVGQQMLDQAVTANKELIEKRVKRIINQVGNDEVKEALITAIENAFSPEKET